jgi:hypothetical protein
MITLSNTIGKKLFDQCQKHFDASKTDAPGSCPLLIKKTKGGPKGFIVFHSAQYCFKIEKVQKIGIKKPEYQYRFWDEFIGFYKTNPKTAMKLTAWPTPASLEYSPEMSV